MFFDCTKKMREEFLNEFKDVEMDEERLWGFIEECIWDENKAFSSDLPMNQFTPIHIIDNGYDCEIGLMYYINNKQYGNLKKGLKFNLPLNEKDYTMSQSIISTMIDYFPNEKVMKYNNDFVFEIDSMHFWKKNNSVRIEVNNNIIFCHDMKAIEKILVDDSRLKILFDNNTSIILAMESIKSFSVKFI